MIAKPVAARYCIVHFGIVGLVTFVAFYALVFVLVELVA